MPTPKPTEHRVYMGLGEAIEELVRTQIMRSMGVFPDGELLAKQKLIVRSLNDQYQLDLGFDCDQDGVPDDIQIFAQAASTSCCRLVEQTEARVRGRSRA